MATLRIFRETTVPSQAALVPYSMYVVAPPARPNYVEIYVTDSAASPNTGIKRVPNTTDIQAMIDASMAAASAQSVFIVADIAARDALSPSLPVMAHVVDASGDATVTSGGATYIYDSANTAWIKTAEWESQDVTIAWADITGRPSSSAAQIDGAVTASHSHTNKTQLDKIDEDGDGNLTYGGELPHIGWDSTGW